MYPSFTGNARKPRNVNLSGRQPNPWTKLAASQTSSVTPGSQHSLAHAQAERAQRQQERDRQKACTLIQRTWRSYSSRTKTKDGWRKEWDHHEIARTRVMGIHQLLEDGIQNPSGPPSYDSASDCFFQMRLLVHFMEIKIEMDQMRLAYYSKALKKTLEVVPDLKTANSWSAQLQRLGMLILDALTYSELRQDTTVVFLDGLFLLSKLIPKRMARHARKYYSVLGQITKCIPSSSSISVSIKEAITRDMFTLLQPTGPETATAYGAFSIELLSQPDILASLGDIDYFAVHINPKLLANSILRLWHDSKSDDLKSLETSDSSLWLLAHFLYIRSHAQKLGFVHSLSEDVDSVNLITALLGPKADEISSRTKVGDGHFGLIDNSATPRPLPLFIRTQLSGLIEKSCIESLLSSTPKRSSQAESEPAFEHASDLASYALTLLRAFPTSADDIRRWLLSSSGAVNGKYGLERSAIMMLWYAAQGTTIFKKISKSHFNAIEAMRPPLTTVNFEQVQAIGEKVEIWNREWTVVLLFFEVYTFVVKFTDDEDFVSGMESFTSSSRNSNSSMRGGALPLTVIEQVIVFLKNMALPLYLNSAELVGNESEVDDASRLSAFFGTSNATSSGRPNKNKNSHRRAEALAGSNGVTKDYLQGLVTGVLRMIHDKDSRRRFLPSDRWLMTNQLDMTHFISAVVQEEQNRHEIDEENEPDDEDRLDDMDLQQRLPYNRSIGLEQEKRQRIQAREAARRKREQIAPWTEILRNLPFLVPFDVRVRIFREFVFQDQVRRRGGKDMVDPEMWRLSHMPGGSQARDALGRPSGTDTLRRHYAKIRRDSIFEDAYEQFYDLGDELANPIQISFIDKFGEEEAGIDGGGVTKEFLNSVTQEAFDPATEPRLFEENEQHLLYPSPTSMEQQKELMRLAGIRDASQEMREGLTELRKRYQFLGRIIGKCLYEGILVDATFAGFFLIKWALTGGTTAASNETSYRASINDLPEFDESLYRGLLQLKNYSGNVEDFGLNFTIVDTIPLPFSSSSPSAIPGGPQSASPSSTTTITRDLIPNGSAIPVTNKNRPRYIHEVVRHRLQFQPADQTRAFLQGLGQIIQPAWLAMFNQSELQTLVSGDRGAIDIDDLRAHTQYGGVYVIGDDGLEHPTIQLFWGVMKSLKNEDRAKVLKFVTSTPRAPLLGFKYLSPPFSIRDSGGGEQERLPSTSTCVNLLKLPRYETEGGLREKLLYAVNSGAGFDLS